MRSPLRIVFSALALAAAFVPAALAYNIHLKDGSILDARAKYQVRPDGRALITLRNGTVTFLPMSQIDVQKTEAANRVNYGSAKVINTPDATAPPAPPSRQPGSLGQLITKRGSEVPPAAATPRRERDKPVAAVPAGRTAKTAAGHVDLGQLDAKPHPNLDLASAIQGLFRAGGGGELKVQTGTRGDRVFLEVSTNSEGSVFKALETSAGVLLSLRDLYPGKVAAIELLMVTPEGERAGQFVLTPELASTLASKKVETASFFVDNVQF